MVFMSFLRGAQIISVLMNIKYNPNKFCSDVFLHKSKTFIVLRSEYLLN